ncbi:MAG: hypothetical protein M3441_18395 [Chloroflexota bacterium]|nr:hypothetical protein [Chloroflexota bacterium]
MVVRRQFVRLTSFALLMLLGGAATGQLTHRISASEQPVSGAKVALWKSVSQASEQEMKAGHLVDTHFGKVFAGASAEKINILEERAEKEYDKTLARPENQRAIAVANIRAFAKNPSLPVVYHSTAKAHGKSGLTSVEIYYAGQDQYVVSRQSNKVLQAGERPRGQNEPGKQYDMTPRYSQVQLEAMARTFIAEHAPDVELTTLAPNHGSKGAVGPTVKNGAYSAGVTSDTNYFFRWEDLSGTVPTDGRDVPFIQVGFTVGGTFLSYHNGITP